MRRTDSRSIHWTTWANVILIASLYGAACATTQPPAERLIECLVGPEPGPGPYCDGVLVPWGTEPFPGADPGRYVCHPLDQHEAYRARCEK